jgi:hypothetical protein
MNALRFKRTKLLKVSVVALAATLTVCLLVVTAESTADASFPGKNGKIAFR